MMLVNEEQLRDLIVDNLITDEEIHEIVTALKLQKLAIDMENKTGRSLVDVQNWLSKEGKFSTQVTNKVLFDLIKESQSFGSVKND